MTDSSRRKEVDMKKVFMIIAIAAILVGCKGKGTRVQISDSVDKFKVEKLFVVDSITVYRFYDQGNAIYTKPDIEEYGYFPIYIEKGIGDEFDVYPFTDNNVCKQIAYIKYVHQLQHLLFSLGINHEMEV